MGVLKSVAFGISALLLVLSLFSLGGVLSISKSIEYNVVHEELSETIFDILENEYNISELVYENERYLLEYCLPHEEYFFEFDSVVKNISCEVVLSGEEDVLEEVLFGEKGSNIELTKKVFEEYPGMIGFCEEHESYYVEDIKKNVSCESILIGGEAIVKEVVGDFVDEAYYEEYPRCDFWNCLKETGSAQFLVSQKAKDYWSSKVKYLVIFSLILVVLIFFILENKFNLPFVLGGSLILAGLPLLKIESFVITISRPFLKGLEFIKYSDTSILRSIISIFFTKAGSVFSWFLSFGILFLIVWLVLRVWSFFTGRDKKSFSKKDIKELIRDELLSSGKEVKDDKKAVKKSAKNLG